MYFYMIFDISVMSSGVSSWCHIRWIYNHLCKPTLTRNHQRTLLETWKQKGLGFLFPAKLRTRCEAAPLSGFGYSAVYICLVGQVVQDAVVSQRCQSGVNRILPLLPAALTPIFLFIIVIDRTLLIAANITLDLWRRIKELTIRFLPRSLLLLPR